MIGALAGRYLGTSPANARSIVEGQAGGATV